MKILLQELGHKFSLRTLSVTSGYKINLAFISIYPCGPVEDNVVPTLLLPPYSTPNCERSITRFVEIRQRRLCLATNATLVFSVGFKNSTFAYANWLWNTDTVLPRKLELSQKIGSVPQKSEDASFILVPFLARTSFSAFWKKKCGSYRMLENYFDIPYGLSLFLFLIAHRVYLILVIQPSQAVNLGFYLTLPFWFFESNVVSTLLKVYSCNAKI